MSTKYGKNFTNFQNVGLQGTNGEPGVMELTQGATNLASTVSISMIPGSTDGSLNGALEQPYFHISNAGLSIGTGFIRMTNVGSSPYGTIRLRSATYLDRDVAYQLPAKSGVFPIMGTFAVQFPALSATTSHYSTIVTVTGIRSEDALCVFLNSGSSSGYDPFGVSSGSTARILIAAKPGDGNITMEMYNALGATAATQLTYSYLAMR